MNQQHLSEFFTALRAPYDNWKNMESWHKNNLANPPYYHISNTLNATIFTYEGYESTDSLRDKTEKNNIVREMLSKALTEPAVIFDCGTYNGKRLLDIISSVTNKENIIKIYGIENNHQRMCEAKELFENTVYDFVPVEGKIEETDFIRYAQQASAEKDARLRTVILGLENIFLNFNGLAFHHDQGITGFLSRMTQKNDQIIMETHRVTQKSNYSEDIETFFTRYFVESGLKEIIGGELRADYSSIGKAIYITGMKKKVEYDGKIFDFSEHTLNAGNINEKRSPRIYIGFSGTLQHTGLFEFMLFNYANNLYVEGPSDIRFSGADTLMRFIRFDKDKWLLKAQRESEYFTHDDKPYFGITPFIALKELFPYYYKNFLYKDSEIFSLDKEVMKRLINRMHFTDSMIPSPPSSSAISQHA